MGGIFVGGIQWQRVSMASVEVQVCTGRHEEDCAPHDDDPLSPAREHSTVASQRALVPHL